MYVTFFCIETKAKNEKWQKTDRSITKLHFQIVHLNIMKTNETMRKKNYTICLNKFFCSFVSRVNMPAWIPSFCFDALLLLLVL